MLTTRHAYEPNWKVESADVAAEVVRSHGRRILLGPEDIPIGRVAAVEDPFGNRLVLLASRGTYRTDASGDVTDVA